MHKSFNTLAMTVFLALPCLSFSELVFDSQLPGKTIWWYGAVTSQDQGNAIKLGGTARKLDSVTLNYFYHNAGDFEITASIYAMPATIANDDVLTNPLWTSTVQKSFTAMGWEDIDFVGAPFMLPDELALVFSLKALSGQAAFSMHAYKSSDNPPVAPAVGSLISDAYYTGITDVPTGWWYPTDGIGTLFVTGKINASAVPEPVTVALLASASLAAAWRRRRK